MYAKKPTPSPLPDLQSLFQTSLIFLLCTSRPRRFGKSMAADMLVAYYSKGRDSRELFSGLTVSRENEETFRQAKAYKAHLNQHNVIRFDVQRFLSQSGDCAGIPAGSQGWKLGKPDGNIESFGCASKKYLGHGRGRSRSGCGRSAQ
ncbi:MAG: AAA family ATPase [Lachnospiraceae bacterium]|nr:AAA family ATPase [Lachnospiraceae bacterium]